MSPVGSELRIEISKVGNKYTAVTTQGDGQVILRNEFQHDSSGPRHLQPTWLVSDGNIAVSDPHQASRDVRGKPNSTHAATDGRRLYRYLFGKGKELREFLVEHHAQGPVYLTLAIDHEAGSLWRLPWEYLFDGKEYLCLSGNMRISRRASGTRSLTLQPSAPPLQVLAVIANPEDQASFDVAAESTILQESLDDLIGQGKLDLEILAEPTSSALLEAIRGRPYQVIHFIGHGVYHLAQHEGFLCLEDEIGKTELVSGAQLPRFLEASLYAWSPRLCLLSTCRNAQVGVFDAFASVAGGLLQHDIPGVLTVPAGMEASAALAFFKTLYEALTKGGKLVDSLHEARIALRELDEKYTLDQQRFNWGLPALYQRAPDLQLIDPEIPGEGAEGTDTSRIVDSAAQVMLKPVIGRRQELQAVRKALKAGATVFDIRGSEGIGKRDLMLHLLPRLRAKPSESLVVHCREAIEPLSVLQDIADFWRCAAGDSEDEAATMLLDPRLDPWERAQAAQKLKAKKRFIYLFDEIDAWFDDQSETQGSIQDTTLREILLGLLSVPGRSTFFFTGARQWQDLARLNTENRREIHLPLLTLQPSIRLMHQWPELRQIPLRDKEAIHWQLGGHPKAQQFLAGLLYLGGDLEALLTSPPVSERSTEAWMTYLIQEILGHLDPGEHDVLRVLALLKRPFSAATISDLTPVAAQHTGTLVEKWRRLGIIEETKPDPAVAERFVMQPTAQRLIKGRMTPDEARTLHHQAAAYYGAPLIDAARRQVLARNITAWSQERIEWLARDENGILGVWLRQPDEATHPPRIVERAIAWEYHLIAAGDLEAAAHIAHTLAPELNRRGQRDLARRLLERAASSTWDYGFAATVADHVEEPTSDRLRHALRVYLEVYESIDPEEGGAQRAHVLMRAGSVYQRLGNRDAAIQSFKSALGVMRTEQDEEGEAECLYRLATTYREMADPRQALVYSQAAIEHYEALTYPYGLAAVKREQGHILKELGQFEYALGRFAASLQLCRELDDRQCIAENLTEIGLLFERLGQTDMAIQVIQEALDHYEYLKSPEHGQVLSLLEQLYVRRQRLTEAVTKFTTAKRSPSP